MRTLLLSGALLLASCGPPSAQPDAGATQAALVPVNMNGHDKVDLLFLIDNSNSMESMQTILQDSFYEFFQPFEDLQKKQMFVDFHIGVVTSDYGSGATGAPGCDQSPGGQQGILQAVGVKAARDCKAPVGARFIQYGTRPGAPNNLPPGQDLADTFTCMASNGANGCGFEHQLESVRAALLNTSENAGFLRPDAALAVAFLTNEDDASAPPDTDVFDKRETMKYGYEDSYSRQTRFAVICCPPGKASCTDAELTFPPYDNSQGPLAGCRPAPNPPGQQYEVKRYIDFFTLPAAKGGIKADPNDVILYAIDAPESPFQVIFSNPGTPAGQAYAECPALNESANPPCVPVLQHSCHNPTRPELFGDPAVRLNTVVRAAPTHRIWSICEEDYSVAIRQLALMVASQLGTGCLTDAIFTAARPDDIDCKVSDVKEDPDRETVTDLLRCTGNNVPCWRVENKDVCSGISQQGIGLTIDRGGMPMAADTHVRAGCTARR